MFERRANALNLLGTMERLVQNLRSSMDEKQLAIAGGLLAVFVDMLRSSSNTMLVLEALYEIYVADGVIIKALEPLEPLSEDDVIKEYATRVRGAIVTARNDELRGDAGKEQKENAKYYAEDEPGKDNND
ncbi:hypothetical protein FRC10_003709 [Ceratobasidium sp. 414]|nr:hypothetical protein FRC10_003709 [Ceratobasidium sp. 414]